MPTILTKRSNTPGAVPATANLTNAAGGAELAVNTADKRLFSINSSSAIIEVGTNPSSLTCADASFTVARVGSLTISSLSLTNVTVTSATVTTLTGTSANITNISGTSLTVSTATLSGGTANGVLYLNGSKVATSGSALVFDGTNLGIGVSPSYRLDILASGSAAGLRINNASAGKSAMLLQTNGTTAGIIALTGFIQGDSTTNFGFFAETGNDIRLYTNGSPTPKAVLDTSGNLGIGTSSPSAKLSIAGNSSANITPDINITRSSSGTTIQSGPNITFTDGTTNNTITLQNTQGRFGVWNYGAGVWNERLSVDASGNLGLGVTPSASTIAQFEGGSNLLIVGRGNAYFSNNATFNSGFKYINSAAAGQYAISGKVHTWSISSDVTPTAGNAISFTQAMTLDADGDLGVGTTSPSYRFQAVRSGDGITAGFSGGTYGIRFDNGGTFSSGASTIHGVDSTLTGSYQQLNINGSVLTFQTSATERARITSGGLFLVNTDNSTSYGNGHRIYRDVSEGGFILSVDGGGEYAALFQDVASGGYSTAAAGIWVGKNSSNSRSINAGGTVNASGTDYAEYMEKAGEFVISKGDVCGVDANGKLTNVYANAVAFVVKSTNPSYVGGDSWGAGYKDDPEGLEAARQKVDRIAFSGQVPVNVLGAMPGQYIVPVNDNGAIKGVAVSNPSFEQYQTAVGKVIAIEDDGRARIIVKIA